jgi:hypothetical protein
MKLTKEAQTFLKDKRILRNIIAINNECHPVTVDRWVDFNGNNSPLTKLDNLNFIAEKMGRKVSEIIEDQPPIITTTTIK